MPSTPRFRSAQRLKTMVNGYRRGSMPAAYTGGLNDRSAASLKAFLADGGTLIFLNRSCRYALERLSVPAENVVDGVTSSQFYSPGSLLNVELEPGPLTYGLPRAIAIWSQNSPAFRIEKRTRAVLAAKYLHSGILASGWLLGESYLADRAALVEIPRGKGKVILFGMRPQYRGQSYQTFKLFFNALLRF